MNFRTCLCGFCMEDSSSEAVEIYNRLFLRIIFLKNISQIANSCAV